MAQTIKPDTDVQLEKRKEALFEAFPDVLRDTLPDHDLSGTPMRIELRDDVPIKPRKATTCKLTPTHLQADADKLLQDLLADDIIERVPEGEVSEWISPAFFVPKPGGNGVRLSLIHI